MNILPFVFTFLLLLTLLTSLMLTSTSRTQREKQVILATNEAYLSVISKQNKDQFLNRKPAKEEKKTSHLASNLVAKKKNDRQARCADKTNQDYRDVRMGYEGSKMNLWPMIHDDNPQLRDILQKTLVRLIQILYEGDSFHTTNHQQDVGNEIAKSLIEQKIKSFEQLQFSDPELDHIYYTMVKGTNTGYPPLTEYCRLENDSKPPIHFRFASKPILRAALGEELSQQLFSLEQKKHEQNKRMYVLKKEELLELIQNYPASWISSTLLTELFYFQNRDKGFAQLSHPEKGHIRAFHKAQCHINSNQ